MTKTGETSRAERSRASAALRKQKAVDAVERLGESLHEAVVVDGQQATTIGGAQVIAVGAAHSLSIGSRQSTDVGTDQVVTIGGDQTVSVGKSRRVEIGKDDRLEIGKDLTVAVGTKLVLRAAQEIRIEVGAASLVLKANGDVQLSGTRITIDGTAEVHLRGANVHTN